MYATLDTLERLTHAEFLARHPNTGFPPELPDYLLRDYGVALIEYDPAPDVPHVPGDLRLEGTRIIQGWVMVPQEIPDISTQYAHRLSDLNDDYERAFAALRADYPLSEIETWTMQREEAYRYAAWLEQNDAGSTQPPAVPFLTVLNETRELGGIEGGLSDLVAKIIANDKFYTQAVARLTGIRHTAEKQLKAALQNDDQTSLETVTWSFD